MRYLLDTCVISEVTKPRPTARVLTWLDIQEELSLFLSVITLASCRKASVAASQSETPAAPAVGGPRADAPLYGPDARNRPRGGPAVGRHGGGGRAAGAVAPVLDGLLAATALAGGLTLVTRNTAHMQATGVTLFDPWTG